MLQRRRYTTASSITLRDWRLATSLLDSDVRSGWGNYHGGIVLLGKLLRTLPNKLQFIVAKQPGQTRLERVPRKLSATTLVHAASKAEPGIGLVKFFVFWSKTVWIELISVVTPKTGQSMGCTRREIDVVSLWNRLSLDSEPSPH